MASYKDLSTICELWLKWDKEALIKLIHEIAVIESNSWRRTLYNALIKILNKYGNNNAINSSWNIEASLLKNDSRGGSNIWMSSKIKKEVGLFIEYIRNHKTIGNNAFNRILLYGPPGTGKTTLWWYIANKIGLPINYVKISDIISPRLGETLKNIDNLFAWSSWDIIYLDEFDAFSKDRKDNNDIWELKRTVNSFIQTLDYCPDNKIVIVATNLIEYIDPAILRRFKFRVLVNYLDDKDKQEFVEHYVANNHRLKINISTKDIEFILKISDLKNIDEIVSVFEKAAISSLVVKWDKNLSLETILETLMTESFITKEKLKYLRKNNKVLLHKLETLLSKSMSKKNITDLMWIHRNSFNSFFVKDAK